VTAASTRRWSAGVRELRQRRKPIHTDLRVRLQPRARKDELVGERSGALVIRVAAPPVDGKANDALCRLVARVAGVPRSRVAIVRGHTSRDKVVRVEGVEERVLRAALRPGGV
jgi:uncharacterized protein (TIGR00251 family)